MQLRVETQRCLKFRNAVAGFAGRQESQCKIVMRIRTVGIQPQRLVKLICGRTTSRGEDFCGRDIDLHRSPKKIEQHSNPFFGRQHLGDHDLQAAKRAFYDMNELANLERGIDRDDLINASV